MNKKIIYKALILLTLAGCAGAKFVEPKPIIPNKFINATNTTPTEIINEKWWQKFDDTLLDTLVQWAIDSNKNLMAIAQKVEIAELKLKNARTSMAPNIGLAIEAEAEKLPHLTTSQKYSIQPTMSWEIDIFGKLRYAAKAAKADLLAQEQYYRSAWLGLIAQVGDAYFEALRYDLSLRISELTLQSRRESSQLIGYMYEYGEATEIVVQQNRALVQSAEVAVASYRMARQEAVYSLCELLSCTPRVLNIDGRRLMQYSAVEQVPVGLPSDLLERRPDILQAYFELQAAYADVGVAIANRFPSLVLTGEGGLISTAISSLFKGQPFGWSAAAELTQPILAFGQNLRNLRIAKAQRQQAVYGYEQTVVEALVEVEKSLVQVRDYSLQINHQNQVLTAEKITMDLTGELYLVGQGDYLNVLDAKRNYFSAQLDYIGLLSQRMQAYVGLYKALGGGW